ncbi:hypothetical protein ABZ215_25045 [Amycolatopsis sp. NPDC006131]|uniref:hypothetical protein n=1 Tax=Amycolatopsis sp. NPDC006131 TaxID=3156731 RepID=UPI0033ACA429
MTPDFSNVHRVPTEHGSDVEPPFDYDWDDLTKLRWHAAVVSHDCAGLPIRVEIAVTSVRSASGDWQRVPGRYNVLVASSSIGPLTYEKACSYLSGVQCGWEVAQSQ